MLLRSAYYHPLRLHHTATPSYHCPSFHLFNVTFVPQQIPFIFLSLRLAFLLFPITTDSTMHNILFHLSGMLLPINPTHIFPFWPLSRYTSSIVRAQTDLERMPSHPSEDFCTGSYRCRFILIVIVIRCRWPNARETVKIVSVCGRTGGGGVASGKKGGKDVRGTVGRAGKASR
jgi:hypothetical protein